MFCWEAYIGDLFKFVFIDRKDFIAILRAESRSKGRPPLKISYQIGDKMSVKIKW
jgi:hypothetical protein